jgi:carbonic anhydrase
MKSLNLFKINVKYFCSKKEKWNLFTKIRAKLNENEYNTNLNLDKSSQSNAEKIKKESHKQKETNAAYLRLLEGNKLFVQQKNFDNPEYFKTLSHAHAPKYFLIGCSDARVPPTELTKTSPGEIFIHRNIANQVIQNDLNCMATLQYAVEYLKVEHVIVMGHTKCGGIKAANSTDSFGLIDHWLQNIRDVAFIHKSELNSITDEEEFLKKLTELNIKQQAINVCKSSFVQKAWSEGRRNYIHGWMCDVETGIIKDLKLDKKEWINIKDSYSYNFNI